MSTNQYLNNINEHVAEYPSFDLKEYLDWNSNGINKTDTFDIPAETLDGRYRQQLSYGRIIDRTNLVVTIDGSAATVIPFGTVPTQGNIALDLIKGVAEFNPNDEGLQCVITYTGTGSGLLAYDINRLQKEIKAHETKIVEHDGLVGGGIFKAINGNDGTPSYTFGDTTTGMYLHDDLILGFTADETANVFIDAAGLLVGTFNRSLSTYTGCDLVIFSGNEDKNINNRWNLNSEIEMTESSSSNVSFQNTSIKTLVSGAATGSTAFPTIRGLLVDTDATGDVNGTFAAAKTAYGIDVNCLCSGADLGAGSTRTVFGGKFTATGSLDGNTTVFGIRASATGGDTNWAGYFDHNVGFAADILPANDSVSNLGSITKYFANTYTDNLFAKDEVSLAKSRWIPQSIGGAIHNSLVEKDVSASTFSLLGMVNNGIAWIPVEAKPGDVITGYRGLGYGVDSTEGFTIALYKRATNSGGSPTLLNGETALAGSEELIQTSVTGLNYTVAANEQYFIRVKFVVAGSATFFYSAEVQFSETNL